jgi:DNA-binding transcriptional MerR regulator
MTTEERAKDAIDKLLAAGYSIEDIEKMLKEMEENG